MAKRYLLAGAGALMLALALPDPSAAQDTTYMETQSPVADVQRMLNDLGYEAGPVDGIVGPRTRAAIRAYQEDTDLPVTGEIDDDLLASLQARGTRPVDDPAAVTEIETQLDRLNYAVGEIDGKVDMQLHLALAAYKRSTRAPVDGPNVATLPLIERQQNRNDSDFASKLIWNVETALADRGYDPGRIDGTYDPFTAGAITDYCTDAELDLNGKINAMLLDSLGIADPRGVTPLEILEMETRLERHGHQPGAVDGIADASTDEAIRAYQAEAGLAETGVPSIILLEDMRRTVRLPGDEAPPEA